jgi:glycosyltransferase involved in cell wall biosynthesis
MITMDLHVHSGFSKRPSQWILQKINCPESFTRPMQVYRAAMKKGMSHVTITDHNTIDGVLSIAHLPGVFIGEEITTYFPEDGCKIHVLAWRITESQHEDIQKLRPNVFELAAYLHRENIFHAVAHPLYAVNDRLTLDHVEKMMLLFRNFEINGSRNERQNAILESVLSRITPSIIDRLSEKHRIEPLCGRIGKKNLVGGSDDHSGLNVARTYTRVPGTSDLAEAFLRMTSGRSEVMGKSATPLTMAHNLYGIAYQFYCDRFKLDRHTQSDPLLKFLDRSLKPERAEEGPVMSMIYSLLSYRKRKRQAGDLNSLTGLIRKESDRLMQERPDLIERPDGDSVTAEDRGKRWFAFVNHISNKVLSSTADRMLGAFSRANLPDIFHTLGSLGSLYTLMAPYFVAFSQFTKDRTLARELAGKYIPFETSGLSKENDVNMAHFTDTYYDVNGVALTLQRQVAVALKNEKNLTLITCDGKDRENGRGVAHFKPVGVYDMPAYNCLKLFYPPFLEMLDFCHQMGFTHIHTATPGPIGLAALAISRILKLPIIGTYHTAFPQYAQFLTGDPMIEDLTWKYTLWYYNQLDWIYVSSRDSRRELTEKGVKPEKIRVIERGIDITAFHPSRRNGFLAGRFGGKGDVTALYVGRVSREKNLSLLVSAFKALSPKVPGLTLAVVGEGPYLADMKRELEGFPAVFAGYLGGTDLHAAYASADFFVFPSTTDTFGNVVMEAQASGIPVIVTDKGGPVENMIPGETGLVVSSDGPEPLANAMLTLATNHDLRTAMGRAARAYLETRSFEKAYIATWKMLENPQPEVPDAPKPETMEKAG